MLRYKAGGIIGVWGCAVGAYNTQIALNKEQHAKIRENYSGGAVERETGIWEIVPHRLG